MKCKRCSQKAVCASYCKKHFFAYVEAKVDKTIKQNKLVTKKDKIVVGVSGGKDSLTVLYILRKYTKNLLALCIDEGIAGYRAKTIVDMKAFCKEHKIEYKIVSYKDEFGKTLDQMVKKLPGHKPCAPCGAFRRYLLNKKARDFGATKLATGHNADDEAQAILMNLFRHQTNVLPRLGPMTGMIRDKKFIPRIKPLYFVTEKETAAYAFLKGFQMKYTECPNSVRAYRREVGEFLNNIEAQNKGAKLRLLNKFIKALPKIKEQHKETKPLQYCKNCAEPCMQVYCKACQFIRALGRAA